MTQLVFEWPAPISYASVDFIPSPSNQDALDFIRQWPEQHNASIALLYGTKGVGKTHLAHLWAERIHATRLSAGDLGGASSEDIWGNHPALLLEDIEKIMDETTLFHLLRHAEIHKTPLLLTASLSAQLLGFTLPDLRSRLLALPCAEILPPDDMLLRIFCLKLCTDHQVRVEEDVISYLIKRSERSFASLHDTLYKLIRASMSEKHEITIPWLKITLLHL